MASGTPPRNDRLSSGTRRRPLRALLIEDAEDLRALFASEMESAGFIVDQTAKGDDGVEKVRQFDPDVIVLDLALPGLNGFSVARLVRALDPQRRIAILAVTALTSASLHQAALAAGCDLCLAKPVEASTVIDHAIALCERRDIREIKGI